MRSFVLLLLTLGCTHAADFTVEPDLEYGRVNGKPLLLDVYRPTAAAEKPRAGIILVHGGGWVGGNKKDMREIGETAAKAGYVAVSVGYRLVFGAENQWPVPLDDVQRAVRWTRANATRLNVDPARLGAAGASAGGHLAVCLGTMDTRDNSDAALAGHSSRVRCVVDIFGPTFLDDDFAPKVRLGKTANELIRMLLGVPALEKPERAREASPLYRVDAKSAPFLIFHGRKDGIVPPEQSEKLHAALQKAGVESKLIIFEDEDHGFAKKQNRDKFTAETLAFFAKHLAP